MPKEANKATVRRFLEGPWNYDKLTSFQDLLADDYICHSPAGDLHGRRAFRDSVASELETISDLIVVIDDIIGEDDRVSVRYTCSFVHHGEFMGALPHGELITLRGVSVHRVAEMKILESWEAYDRRSLLRDLGAEQTLSPADREAITEVAKAAQKVGFANRPALAKLYWAEHAEIVAANGVTIQGGRAVREWLQRFPPVSEWKLSIEEVDGAGELAYVRGRYTIELSQKAKLPFDTGKYLEIWRKQTDGSWKVIRNVYSSELATRSKTKNSQALAAH